MLILNSSNARSVKEECHSKILCYHSNNANERILNSKKMSRREK
jgi:hypothetical protein